MQEAVPESREVREEKRVANQLATIAQRRSELGTGKPEVEAVRLWPLLRHFPVKTPEFRNKVREWEAMAAHTCNSLWHLEFKLEADGIQKRYEESLKPHLEAYRKIRLENPNLRE